MNTLRRSIRELRALLDEIAMVDWRHPAWWATVAATATFERWPIASGRDLDADYLATDGGPRSDTFMATPCTAPDAARAVAAGVIRARAAFEALVALDGTLPGQPLLQQLDARSSSIQRCALERSRRIVFAAPTGVYLTTLETSSASDGDLVAELAAAYAGSTNRSQRLCRIDPQSVHLLDAAIAVSLWSEDLATLRHAHRRAWNGAGGPWLGLAHSTEFACVTTSHTVVDGYGHALIAARVLAAPVPDTLVALARRHLGATTLAPAPALAQARPLGIASCELPGHPSFAELLCATGWTLDSLYQRHLTRKQRLAQTFTPTIQVPIAPGPRDDPHRFRRRVAPGLVALRMERGVLEDPQDLKLRLGALITREAACAGILGRARDAALRMPLPISIKRRSVGYGVVPHPLLPAIEVLAGRACLSSLAFPEADLPGMPLYAGSAPALDPCPGDPRGGVVVTVIRGRDRDTLTASGTGLTGTEAGARAFLDAFQGALLRAQAVTTRVFGRPAAG